MVSLYETTVAHSTHSSPPVTFGGSILFLLFGIIYLSEAFAANSDVMPMAPENGTPP